MGRLQRSDRGGGQPDPQEALRRAREAVSRERAARDEGHALAPDGDERGPGAERVGDALREHDEQAPDRE